MTVLRLSRRPPEGSVRNLPIGIARWFARHSDGNSHDAQVPDHVHIFADTMEGRFGYDRGQGVPSILMRTPVCQLDPI